MKNISKYKVGQKVLINHIDDPYANLDGASGTIEYIDDMGQLHGTWGGLAIIPEEDDFIVIDDLEESIKPLIKMLIK